ncbi:hypothetical protein K6V43_01400, partial [Streptococcus suis]|nr:hypothetical protein [Streptococcus suis]
FETFFRSSVNQSPQETTQLFYHLHLLLSTTFSNFFVSFQLEIWAVFLFIFILISKRSFFGLYFPKYQT